MHRRMLCWGLLILSMGTVNVSCSNSSNEQKNLITSSQQADMEAPSAPTNLLATGVTTSQINLSWNASNDNVAVAGYQICRGETTISTVTGTSYNDTDLASSSTYTYTIRAVDSAGNVSIPSSSVSAATFPKFGLWTLMSLAPTEIMFYTASVAVNEEIFVYKGGGWRDYWRYSTSDNTWHPIAPIPDDKARPYFDLISLGDDYLYTFDYWGSSGPVIWQYSISNNIWSQLASYPGGTVYSGTYAVGAIINNEKLVYVFTGPDDFWKFSITNNEWNKMTNAPPFSSVMLSVENNYIYGIHIGSNNWWRYSLLDDTLMTLSSTPVVFETQGAKLAKSGDNIYAIRSGTYDYDNQLWLPTSDFWRYSISRNEWFPLDPLPKGVPSDEGALSSVADGLYLIIGGPESAIYFLPIN